MRILLTGGAGYLGTVLVRALIDAQHTLHVLDRFSWGTQPLLSACGRSAPKVKVFPGDVRDPDAVFHAQAGCDAVIHLAGVVGYPACDAAPVDADTTNVQGTRIVCELLQRRPLLFASTGSTYGRVAGLATEDLPISPLTRYGRNKAAAEQLVRDAGGVSFRLATLFGLSHRMRWDLLPHTFVKEAVESGEIHLYEGNASRTFLHVGDAASAFVEALRTPLPGGEIYNVGTLGGNYTKRQVAEIALKAAGVGESGYHLIEAAGADPDQRDYAVGFGKVQAGLWGWARGAHKGLGETLPEVAKWARGWR